MVLNSLSLVNQKLAYTRALLALVSEADINDSARARLLRNALLDASVVHLVCAYQHYLRELGENYRIKLLEPITSAQRLVTALGELGKTSSEANELLQLRDDHTSWLANLLRSYEKQTAVPVPSTKSVPVEQENFIALVDVGDEVATGQVSFQDVNLWLQQFVEVIQRQRETSAEY